MKREYEYKVAFYCEDYSLLVCTGCPLKFKMFDDHFCNLFQKLVEDLDIMNEFQRRLDCE